MAMEKSLKVSWRRIGTGDGEGGGKGGEAKVGLNG